MALNSLINKHLPSLGLLRGSSNAFIWSTIFQDIQSLTDAKSLYSKKKYILHFSADE